MRSSPATETTLQRLLRAKPGLRSRVRRASITARCSTTSANGVEGLSPEDAEERLRSRRSCSCRRGG
jgi:hypothetical protein